VNAEYNVGILTRSPPPAISGSRHHGFVHPGATALATARRWYARVPRIPRPDGRRPRLQLKPISPRRPDGAADCIAALGSSAGLSTMTFSAGATLIGHAGNICPALALTRASVGKVRVPTPIGSTHSPTRSPPTHAPARSRALAAVAIPSLSGPRHGSEWSGAGPSHERDPNRPRG
jgi:hypothetical protein